LAWLAGGVAVASAAVYRLVKTRGWPHPPEAEAPEPEPEPDPRADELRRRIAESRALVEERDEFEQAETTVDRADPDVDDRRRSVHEQGRAAVDEMHGGAESS
jgi:hypothetical protein